jgi:hypothetical protein
MNTATSGKRKAMRVATVFTGAAATAVTFAPGALAAPRHAPAQGHTALVNGKTRAVRPDNSGSIRSKGCGTSDVHWLHVEYNALFGVEDCKAFGYAGVFDVYLSMVAQCGGNNYGTIYYSGGKSLSYGPGNTYRNVHKNFSAASIYYWSGNDKCAWPR